MLSKFGFFRVINTILDIDKEFSIRDLAKKAKTGIGTAKTYIDFLYEKRVLNRKILKRNYFFSLNKESLITKQIKILKSIIELEPLVNEIVQKYPQTISILLYGSCAKGEDTTKSDIDILIISRKPIKIKPFKSEKNIKREITFITFTPSEWKKKAKTDKVFYDNVIIYSTSLYGEKPVVI